MYSVDVQAVVVTGGYQILRLKDLGSKSGYIL